MTTGKATATSPESGAVVVVEAAVALPDAGAGGVVEADPISELPQADTRAPTATRPTSLPPVRLRPRHRVAAEISVITGPDVKPPSDRGR